MENCSENSTVNHNNVFCFRFQNGCGNAMPTKQALTKDVVTTNQMYSQENKTET